jgi:hypothetical protein
MYYNRNAWKVIQKKVFPGKAGLYRALILEGLLQDWNSIADLARYIVKNVGGNYKSVYSVIDRKKGPLEWLNQKDFIKRELEGFMLTFKGMSVALVLVEDINKILPTIKQDMVKSDVKEKMKDMTDMPIFKDFFQPKVFEDFLDVLSGYEFWNTLKTKTENLIHKGLNIIDLSAEEFRGILVSQVFADMANRKIFKAFTSKHG